MSKGNVFVSRISSVIQLEILHGFCIWFPSIYLHGNQHRQNPESWNESSLLKRYFVERSIYKCVVTNLPNIRQIVVKIILLGYHSLLA